MDSCLTNKTNGNQPPSQRLHNAVGKLRLGDLEWDEHDQPVENNGHLWTMTVQLNGTTYGSGKGPNKAAAREIAAQQALKALKLE